MLKCEFAEIEDVSIAQPDGVRHTPESRILSSDSLRQWTARLPYDCHSADHAQAGGVFTAVWPKCCLLSESVCCMEQRHWPAQGGTCWLPPLARTAVPAIKEAYFL